MSMSTSSLPATTGEIIGSPTSGGQGHNRLAFPTLPLLFGRCTLAVFLLVMLGSICGPVCAQAQTGQASKQESPVAAIVGGETISFSQVEPPIAAQLFRLRQEIHQLQSNQLNQLVIEKLLRKEADARGIEFEQFVNAEILSQTPAVTDSEVENYYRQNLEAFESSQQTEAQIKSSIREALQQQHNFRKAVQVADALKAKYPVQVFLQSPPLPVVNVEAGVAPQTGNPEAPVTIIEFSDYQCPACRQQYPVIQSLRATYGDRIRWVFKHFPPGFNQSSVRAAESALCANDQGRFWDYHHELFTHSGELQESTYLDIARRLQLDLPQFQSCLDSTRHRKTLMDEVRQAMSIGVDRTPSYVINGRFHPGTPEQAQLVALIEEELSRVSAGKESHPPQEGNNGATDK